MPSVRHVEVIATETKRGSREGVNQLRRALEGKIPKVTISYRSEPYYLGEWPRPLAAVEQSRRRPDQAAAPLRQSRTALKFWFAGTSSLSLLGPAYKFPNRLLADSAFKSDHARRRPLPTAGAVTS